MISPNRQECTSGRGRELFGWFNTIVADFFTFVVGGVNQVLYEKNIFSEENLPCDHNIQIVFVMLSSYARQNLKSTTDYLISSHLITSMSKQKKNKYIKRNFIIRRVFALRRSMINVSWTVWKQTKHQRITYATESPPVRIRRVRRRKHGFGQVRQSPVLCAQKIVQTSTRNKQTNESCAYVRWMNFVIFICSAKRNNPIIFSLLHSSIPFYRHSRLVFLFFSFFFAGRLSAGPCVRQSPVQCTILDRRNDGKSRRQLQAINETKLRLLCSSLRLLYYSYCFYCCGYWDWRWAHIAHIMCAQCVNTCNGRHANVFNGRMKRRKKKRQDLKAAARLVDNVCCHGALHSIMITDRLDHIFI